MRRTVRSLVCGLAAVLFVASDVLAACLTFDDGQVRGHSTPSRVPPRVVCTGGRRMLRITGSPGDRYAIPDNLDIIRSTVKFGHAQNPSARVCFNGDTLGSVFELFQRGGRTGCAAQK